MSARSRCVAFCLALMTMAPVAVFAAQETPAPVEGRGAQRGGRAVLPPRPANPDMMTVQQVEQYFDQVVLYQAQAQLQLSDDQFMRFGSALRRLQVLQRQQQRRRMQALRDLNALLATPQPDTAEITAKIAALDEMALQSVRETQDVYGGIDLVLTVRQRARFRVFEEAMERRKLDLLSRARRQVSDAPAGRAGPAPR